MMHKQSFGLKLFFNNSNQKTEIVTLFQSVGFPRRAL
jgi:hypothetical protein